MTLVVCLPIFEGRTGRHALLNHLQLINISKMFRNQEEGLIPANLEELSLCLFE